MDQRLAREYSSARRRRDCPGKEDRVVYGTNSKPPGTTEWEQALQLRKVLRTAYERTLPFGWVWLPAGDTIDLDTACLILSDIGDDEFLATGTPGEAIRQGFPAEGLDVNTIEDIASSAARLVDGTPSDALLLEAYLYYLRFDAFLPAIGAPPPLTGDAAILRIDREFYDALGPERGDASCRAPACERGAIQYSLFCKVHHFEAVKQKPCPFSD